MQCRKRSCDEGLQSCGCFCAQAQSKIWKRIKNERIFTFQVFMKKANHLACFNDLDHQNRNFMVSIMVRTWLV